MTIHMFDGFIWPGGMKRNPKRLECASEFDFPLAYNLYARVDAGQFLVNTSGNGSSANLDATIQLKTPKRIPHDEKIVVGCRCSLVFSNTIYDRVFVCIQPIPDSSTITSAFRTGGINISSSEALPGFILGRDRYNEGLALIERASEINNGTTTPFSYVISPIVTLPGVNLANSTMFEVEYDFAANTIKVYVDDVLVLTHSYTFTAVQKQDSFWSLQCFNSGESSTKVTTTAVECFYLADHRLGPVKVVNNEVDSAAEVSDVFGEPPYVDKVTTASDGSSFLSTKETGRATFTSSELPVGDIVAVRVASKLSSEPRSANESVVSGAVVVKNPQSEVVFNPVVVPSKDFSIVSTVMETNPLTGNPWTPEEVQTLEFGLDVGVKPRFE